VGSRGPQKTSAAALKARGSWRADIKETASGPMISPSKQLRAPKWLTKAGKKKFRELIKQFAAIGRHFHQADADMIAAYCESFIQWRMAELQLSVLLEADLSAYWYVTDKGGLGIHPMTQAVDKAYARMMRSAKEIGLLPLPKTQAKADEGKSNPTADRFKKMGRNKGA
jgi:P27 family predicted phage terminase small subunit